MAKRTDPFRPNLLDHLPETGEPCPKCGRPWDKNVLDCIDCGAEALDPEADPPYRPDADDRGDARYHSLKEDGLDG